MKVFLHHQWLGPVVMAIVCVVASVAIWRSCPSQGQKIESIALACAAMMMFWAAWGSRGTAIASRRQLMPVIDIGLGSLHDLGQGTDPPQGLTCWLSNIGNGPALSLRIQRPRKGGSPELIELDALGGGVGPLEKEVAVTKRNGSHEILVCYKDVFDQECESRREISRDTATGVWTVRPMKVHCT